VTGAKPHRPGRTSRPGRRGPAAVLHPERHADLCRGEPFPGLCLVPRCHV